MSKASVAAELGSREDRASDMGVGAPESSDSTAGLDREVGAKEIGVLSSESAQGFCPCVDAGGAWVVGDPMQQETSRSPSTWVVPEVSSGAYRYGDKTRTR